MRWRTAGGSQHQSHRLVFEPFQKIKSTRASKKIQVHQELNSGCKVRHSVWAHLMESFLKVPVTRYHAITLIYTDRGYNS